MKNKNLIKRLGTAAVAVALCMTATVGTTFAYYTDTTYAEGSLSYKWSTPTTEIEEEPDGVNKEVTIKNTGDAPVLVRVKALYAQSNAKVIIGEGTESDWVTDGSGWFYYNKPLWNKGEATSKLVFKVDPLDSNTSVSEFNVTVVQQCAGLAWDAGWNNGAGSYAGQFVKGEDMVVIGNIKDTVAAGMEVAGMGTIVNGTKSDNGMEG